MAMKDKKITVVKGNLSPVKTKEQKKRRTALYIFIFFLILATFFFSVVPAENIPVLGKFLAKLGISGDSRGVSLARLLRDSSKNEVHIARPEGELLSGYDAFGNLVFGYYTSSGRFVPSEYAGTSSGVMDASYLNSARFDASLLKKENPAYASPVTGAAGRGDFYTDIPVIDSDSGRRLASSAGGYSSGGSSADDYYTRGNSHGGGHVLPPGASAREQEAAAQPGKAESSLTKFSNTGIASVSPAASTYSPANLSRSSANKNGAITPFSAKPGDVEYGAMSVRKRRFGSNSYDNLGRVYVYSRSGATATRTETKHELGEAGFVGKDIPASYIKFEEDDGSGEPIGNSVESNTKSVALQRDLKRACEETIASKASERADIMASLNTTYASMRTIRENGNVPRCWTWANCFDQRAKTEKWNAGIDQLKSDCIKLKDLNQGLSQSCGIEILASTGKCSFDGLGKHNGKVGQCEGLQNIPGFLCFGPKGYDWDDFEDRLTDDNQNFFSYLSTDHTSYLY